MRQTYKNPLFDYKAFASKKTRLSELLEEYAEDCDDDVETEICAHLSPCKDALNLAAFMSPFYVEFLADEFDTEIRDYDTSSILAHAVCKKFVENYEEDATERTTTWVVNATAQIYDACTDIIGVGDIFNKICAFYNANRGKAPKFSFKFPTIVFDKNEFVSLFEKALVRHLRNNNLHCVLDLVRVKVECESGFLSFMFVYLNASALDVHQSFWQFGNFAFVTINPQKSAHQAPIPLLSDIIHMYAPKIQHVSILPIWVTSVLQEINLFPTMVHYTDITTATEITPTNLQTRTADYQKSPTVTFARDYIPSVTKSQSQRALIYCWNKHLLANYKYKAYSNSGIIEVDGLEGAYGYDALFLFCNISLSFLKTTDHEIQSVCLLQDIIESVPCLISKSGTIQAYIGLEADGKTPLFYVTESDWKRSETPFISFVLDSLCEFLDSEKYDPSMNLNRTVRP